MPTAPSPAQSRAIYAALLVALFAYLTFARVHEALETFLLLRDQMRDWRIALGPFSSLPLIGPQSTAGGSSLGPIYYWVLWSARHVFGPWFQNLPHAGAYGIAVLQGATDLFLLDTLRLRTGSTWVALAVVLLAATTPHDLAVSSTIWNPAVSVAFVKLALALRLRRDADASLWWTAATTAAAWLAVQAHSAAIFVAVPLAASYVVHDLTGRRPVRALQQTRVIFEVILLLQVPFLIHALTTSDSVVPIRALAGASSAVVDGALRWRESMQSMLASTASILFAPSAWSWWPTLVAIGMLVVLVRSHRSVVMLSATVAPLVTAALGLAVWQGNYDTYWYLPVAPCAALTVVLAITWWRGGLVAMTVVVVLLAAQPARVAAADFSYRMPEYGALRRGTLRIVRQTAVLRRLDTSFPMPPFSDQTFLFEVLGGRFSDDAEFDAVIDETGDVRFVRASR